MVVFNPEAPVAHIDEGIFSRIGRSIGGAVRSFQYARMLKVMSELSDAQLNAIGITKTDIPRVAYESIYGSDEYAASCNTERK